VKFFVLASGSSGNAFVLEAGGTRLLIEAGLPRKEVARRLSLLPGAPALAELDALLVSHEHSDHGAHARAHAEAGLLTHATAGTLAALRLSDGVALAGGVAQSMGGCTVMPVPVPHDAADPVGFVLEGGGLRAGILLDCGHPTPELAEAYAGCDLLVLEANHDPSLLSYGHYPRSLKQRIGGRLGHLSNLQAAEFVRSLASVGDGRLPACIVLVHLSMLNNRASLVRGAMARAIGRAPVRVLVAPPGDTLGPVTLGRGPDGVTVGLPGEQLGLPLGFIPPGRLGAPAGARFCS
jgi:phosphoribosyl 1,2-cyclic phosphodiesterase